MCKWDGYSNFARVMCGAHVVFVHENVTEMCGDNVVDVKFWVTVACMEGNSVRD